MSGGTLDEIAGILEQAHEADGALRAVVSALAGAPGAVWAGIAFLEEGVLTLGPSAGEPMEAHRTRVPISFAGEPIGELQVDGTVSRSLLEKAADLVSPYVLIGWDTGGEPWEP